jgi:DNA adenine methylase
VAKPFLKWAGGKRDVSEKLISLMPSKFDSYYEPFLGAGSLFFRAFSAVEGLDDLEHKVFLNDSNPELINCWLQVMNNSEGLTTELKLRNALNAPWSRESFEKLREWDRADILAYSEVERAARFILLNRLGFNGLCRMNQSGKFNAPWGKITHPSLPSLVGTSKVLVKAQASISCSNYLDALTNCKKGDFVYADPPYVPLKKGGFTSYSAEKFTEEQQLQLVEELKRLDAKGVQWMLSGHDEPQYHSLYDESSFRVLDIISIDVRRSIGADGESRGKVKELIIRNYLD